MKMNVLVACEFSGVVRDAFLRRGHQAVSCDLAPSDLPGPHLEQDVLQIINREWDLMIAFPPCTYLAVSGARWFADRMHEQRLALGFVQELMEAPIEKIAIENPVGVISTFIRKPDQIVQPWMFGDAASKKTCFWLKGLPPLLPTDVLKVPASGTWPNQTPSGQNNLGPSPHRARTRAITYLGIAEAMAEQWG